MSAPRRRAAGAWLGDEVEASAHEQTVLLRHRAPRGTEPSRQDPLHEFDDEVTTPFHIPQPRLS